MSMDKIERLAYIITSEIKDRPVLEKFSQAEYRELVRRIRDFCKAELKRDKNGGI